MRHDDTGGLAREMRLLVNRQTDRKSVVEGLVNAGYTVRVDTRSNFFSVPDEHWIVVSGGPNSERRKRMEGGSDAG